VAYSSEKVSSVKRIKREDLPTPELPITINFKR
jgi:hypothetical protein